LGYRPELQAKVWYEKGFISPEKGVYLKAGIERGSMWVREWGDGA
jgi:hypothetical protein